MLTYYNDNEPYVCAWLHNLIQAQMITPGIIDSRSIHDVQPTDLVGVTRAHFFAGIGGWDYALALAGWPIDRPLWTASLPCQPFSQAGRLKGVGDERHLWPAFLRLIAECRPPTIVGEQTGAPAGRAWLAGVRLDLEALGYAVGAADLCAAGVAAPHKRQRLYWMAHANSDREERRESNRADETGSAGGLADTGPLRERRRVQKPPESPGSREQRTSGEPERSSSASGLGQSHGAGWYPWRAASPATGYRDTTISASSRLGNPIDAGLERCWSSLRGKPGHGGRGESVAPAGAWDDYAIIQCRDGESRRAQSKFFLLVDGVSDRVDTDGTKEGRNEERKIDGEKTITRRKEILQTLWQNFATQTLPDRAGRQDTVRGSPVLQPSMHGGMDGGEDPKPYAKLQPQPGAQTDEKCVRNLRAITQYIHALCASPRREPTEQRWQEFTDFMRHLPSSFALAKLHGDTNTATALLVLCQACHAERLVLDTQNSPTTLWASLAHEDQERLYVGFDYGAWRKSVEPLVVPSSRTRENVSRKAVLKGLGNAIVPPLAAVFLRAVLATLTETLPVHEDNSNATLYPPA